MSGSNDGEPRITGIGGVFFKARDAESLRAWYRERLGVEVASWGGCAYSWRDAADPQIHGQTVWSVMPETSSYFDPSPARFMINYRVADLDGFLARLRERGVEVAGEIHEEPNGRFAWVQDPEGHRIELWEPSPAALSGEAEG